MQDLDEIKWGEGAISRDDWVTLRDFIKMYAIKSVIEYGYGISTMLLSEIVEDIVTFETNYSYFKKGQAEGYNLRTWNADRYLSEQYADLVFIDGPAGGQNREWSFKNAVRQSDCIGIHDAQRKEEKVWKAMYLADYTLIAGKRLEIYKRGQ